MLSFGDRFPRAPSPTTRAPSLCQSPSPCRLDFVFFFFCSPAQVFRTDLITAMKIPDSFQLSPDEYYVLADPWRQEWEKGVQVPASAEAIPEPVVR